VPRIRLLVSVAGERGAVRGDAGTELAVDNATARAWCDGERAERVIERAERVETTVRRPV
jgi:hypothetical protein